MPFPHLKFRRNFLQPIIARISYVLFRWPQRIHMYLFLVTLSLAGAISYYQPFGLLYNIKHIIPERPSMIPMREKLINQQKLAQREAYEWLDNLWKNPKQFPHIISNQTDQSNFYSFMNLTSFVSSRSSYQLLTKPRQTPSNQQPIIDDQIIISILYSQQDIDHREGKFYVGQVLQHLLKNYHSRFIITLCENYNNNETKVSDDIDLIRRLVPVFLISTFYSDSLTDVYEREKHAHLQCILANFQSFPNQNYFLLLQDDAQPMTDDFHRHLLSLIDHRIKKQWPIDGHRTQPAFLKIYHPRWLIDYLHPSFYIIVQLIATSLFLTCFSFACVYRIRIFKQVCSNTLMSFISLRSFFFKNNHQKISLTSSSLSNIHRHVKCTTHWTYFLYYFLLITLVLILLNHSNVSWTWRSLHPSLYAIYSAPSCCIPGVLYFRSTYIQVIDYLNSVKCNHEYPIDSAFDDLPSRTHLQTYLVEPNLVHHIGLYSRLRHTYINPFLLD